jgi:two-component system sensor histidine kinase TctE
MRAATSLREGLTRRLLTALVAIGVVGVLAAYPLAGRYADLVYDRELFADVATLAQQVETDRGGALHVNLPPAGQRWLLADHGRGVRFRVVDLRDGKVIAGNGWLGEWDGDVTGSGEPLFRDFTAGVVPYRVAYTRHVVDPDDIPVLVEVGETLGKRESIQRQIVGGMILLIGAMVAAAVALVWRGVSSELAPLRAVEAAAASRSGTNLDPLDPSHAPREVRGLIKAINRMMARLGKAIEAQRRFAANAAHQLRTPLAGVRLRAQMALRQPASEAIRASLLEIEASAMRAGHVLEQLLTLSQAETRLHPGERECTDLADVALHTIERYLPEAIRREIDLGYEGIDRGADVFGTKVLLSELLGNLIDNSIRYGRAGGRITVRTERAADAIVLSVADDGPGFSARERKRAFERFQRANASADSGAGLGLAIVREIAERYTATLSLETDEGQGSRISVAFPRPVLH